MNLATLHLMQQKVHSSYFLGDEHLILIHGASKCLSSKSTYQRVEEVLQIFLVSERSWVHLSFPFIFSSLKSPPSSLVGREGSSLFNPQHLWPPRSSSPWSSCWSSPLDPLLLPPCALGWVLDRVRGMKYIERNGMKMRVRQSDEV